VYVDLGLALCLHTNKAFVKMQGAGVWVYRWVKCEAKVRASQCGGGQYAGLKNAVVPPLKHYEILVINARDG